MTEVWTEDRVVSLRHLWDEGHSTAEIGRRIGVSKNAVVGKANRLNFPARPTPLVHGIQRITECARGHMLTEENVYRLGRSRRCRKCTKDWQREYYQRLRARA